MVPRMSAGGRDLATIGALLAFSSIQRGSSAALGCSRRLRGLRITIEGTTS
jgi:hypothetical protein